MLSKDDLAFWRKKEQEEGFNFYKLPNIFAGSLSSPGNLVLSTAAGLAAGGLASAAAGASTVLGSLSAFAAAVGGFGTTYFLNQGSGASENAGEVSEFSKNKFVSLFNSDEKGYQDFIKEGSKKTGLTDPEKILDYYLMHQWESDN